VSRSKRLRPTTQHKQHLCLRLHTTGTYYVNRLRAQGRLNTAPGRRRKRGAADWGIDRETDSIAARGAGSTTARDAFRCGPLQVVAPLSWRLEQPSHETSESRPLHPLRKAAYRAGGSMLLTMRAHSARPLPIPECRSAVVTTLPAPPSALALVYSDIANCQPMAVTTVLGNLDAGNLAAAVSTRERNDERVISRNRAPATICICTNLHPNAPPADPRAPDRALLARRSTIVRGSCQRLNRQTSSQHVGPVCG